MLSYLFFLRAGCFEKKTFESDSYVIYLFIFSFLVERAVVGLLRLAIRLIRRDDISSQILITLRILLMMHPKVLLSCSKQIVAFIDKICTHMGSATGAFHCIRPP